MTDNAIADLVAALGALAAPDKNGNVDEDGRRYSYTRLDDLDAACRPILAQHGWVWMQDVTTSPGTVHVTTRLLHTSGHTIDHGPLDMPCPRGGSQDIATCATYGRRIQLAAVLGIPAGTDNDARDQTPGRATDAQKAHIWELAGKVWPDLDDAARRDALAAEVASLCDGSPLAQLRDTQAVMVITQLETAITTTPDTTEEDQP
jgi:hypothetical protein